MSQRADHTSGLAWYVVPALPSATGVLDGAEGRHAATVRRTRVGEQLVLTDGAGTRCLATTIAADAKAGTVTYRCDEVITVRQPAVRVTVVQAIPKGERSDLVVDLLTEAGADAIVPWQAARCVARWSGEKARRGVQKWRQVAVQASKQARRPWLPQIGEVATTAQVCELIAGADLAVVLHEAGGTGFARLAWPLAGSVVLIVGPEGGVAPEELVTLTGAGASAAVLGPEVLRTSAAGAVALGAIGVLTDRWDR